MRAAAWLVDTVAASSSRLRGNNATVALLLLYRAQIQSPAANRIANKSARKKLVVVTSLNVKSEPLIRIAPEKVTRSNWPTTNATAAILIPRRQKSSTAALALAGRTTTSRKATPPSSNASKASVAARARTLSRSISRRSQIKRLGLYLLLYLEGDFAARDVSIRRQDLPAQHVGSLDESGQLSRQHPGRGLTLDSDLLHFAVRVEQRQGRVLHINS